ncbi:MAG: hypothetical protein Q7U34_00965 [Anaerolineales bacterium]|nr:hypothetical protein [Anaerolineales bacterium]
MGRILPTLIQQLAETESMLAGFRPTLRKSDQYILGGLFAAARRYAAAISQADALLPFEVALLAMQLEQAKEIEVLRQELEQFRKRNV